ncbi:MAG: metalloprotease TldD [Neisseriales bacterium]|nr:MAG: metalloprotease TldD [Neisseriales bacterium]
MTKLLNTLTNSAAIHAYAKQRLLEVNQLSPNALDKTLQQITKRGIDFADLYFQYTHFESWVLEDGAVKQGSFHIDQGVGVRAVSEDKSALAYSSQITQNALAMASQSVQAIRTQTTTASYPITQTPCLTPCYDQLDPIASLDAASKIAILEEVNRVARQQDKRITQVIAQLAAKYEIIYLARHDGCHVADIRPLVRLSVHVIAEQHQRREEGTSGGGGRTTLAYFDQATISRYSKLAVERALLNLEARSAPAGQMTVVLGSGWPGILLHEAIGHGLEGDFHRKRTSAFTNRMMQKVASNTISVVDNGTLPNQRGSLTIDDEGCAAQHTILIENGILKGIMQDMTNAKLMKQAPTGNGRRESYAALPMPRMTNTYMLNGKYPPEEIIKSVHEGLYAANFGGGQVDITSGRFVFSASEAWRIENGRLSYPVKGATLIGNGPEILQHVSMVGNDLALDDGMGTCGKNGQNVPVGVGQPTLRIDQGLTVGGIAV